MAECSWCGGDARPNRRTCSDACAVRARNRSRVHGVSFNRALGRWVIWCRDGTLMYYARGVMAAHLGRLLGSDELVHHVNEDKTDDSIENLELTSRAEHIRTHMPQLLAARRRAA